MSKYDLGAILRGSIAHVHNYPATLGLGTLLRLNRPRDNGLEPSYHVQLTPESIECVVGDVRQLLVDDKAYATTKAKGMFTPPQSSLAQLLVNFHRERESGRIPADASNPMHITSLSSEADARLAKELELPQGVPVKRDSDGGVSMAIDVPLTKTVRTVPNALSAILPNVYEYGITTLAAVYRADLESVKPLSKKAVLSLINAHYTLNWTAVLVEVYVQVVQQQLRVTLRLLSESKATDEEKATTWGSIYLLAPRAAIRLVDDSFRVGDPAVFNPEALEFSLPQDGGSERDKSENATHGPGPDAAELKEPH